MKRSRRRSRSRSSENRLSSASTSREPKPKGVLVDYKSELYQYLDVNFNIRDIDDFWKFYEKYEAIQKVKKSSLDSQSLINLKCVESDKKLYDKLPSINRFHGPIIISREQFKIFLNGINTYHDFLQKNKFMKLKQLRNAQNDLPIARYKDEIIKKLQETNVLLIAGDTGCGKSTQVPQYILEAGYNRVACTQPRRIACVSLAKRVAYETLTTYDSTIGYQIRFEKTKNKNTKIIFLTEGVLLRQATDTEVMNEYDVFILDEVHERHLNMDFLVGIMKCLLQKRNFKLILMSATINLKLFEEYFNPEGVQVIKVPGRLYPIDIIYKPIIKDPYERKSAKFDCQPYLNILELIDSKYQPHERGDVLIFLNGFNEISTLSSAVTEYGKIKNNWIVLQLHSSLSLEEQDKVFYTSQVGVRKCIISTNIAETSVTIDGVRFVIDSGKVNRMTYDECGINRLYATTISQDSAKQRSGRAGRTGPGICYRLYSEEQLKEYEPFTPAEIHLVPLETLILSMVSMGLADIEYYPFLEKPNEKSLKNSLEKLLFLDALNKDEDGLSLTILGNALSQLPVDLTIGKMLILSTIFGKANSALALASLLSVQNPLVENRYFETQDNRKDYESSHGEPITLLNLYKGWLEIKKDVYHQHKKESSRTWSRRLGIEEQRFYEVTKLLEQFRDILQEAKFLPEDQTRLMSSSERAIRKGELKQLKKVRRELKNDSKDVKSKKLKLRSDAMSEENEPSTDLRDVEFRISNDFKKLQQLLSETRTDSYKELMLLKLILTCALYPQIALEDEFNSSKTVNERLYHTKAKNYIFLRPTSYFSNNVDALELNDSDIDVPPNGYFSKLPLSRKHQILIYQSILETKKTYLMNTYRMPALQTLLLFGKKICTNSTLTRFVFDDFVVINCPFLWQGKVLLSKAINLKKRIKEKLEKKLNNPESNSNEEEIFYFVQELTDFMQSNVSYNMKRVLVADLKVIYSYSQLDLTENYSSNPFDKDFAIVPSHIGGIKVTENVYYSSLVQNEYDIDVENAFLNEIYHCSKCNNDILGVNFFGSLIHDSDCKLNTEKEDQSSEKTFSQIRFNSRAYACEKCKKNLTLTPVEILKHRRLCGVKTEPD